MSACGDQTAARRGLLRVYGRGRGVGWPGWQRSWPVAWLVALLVQQDEQLDAGGMQAGMGSCARAG
jgi:hypothetical protein